MKLNPGCTIILGRCWLAFAVLAAPTAFGRQQSIPDPTQFHRKLTLAQAERFLAVSPVTVTAFRSPRSAGGVHDYFSEGDYWWPDPKNPDGPYIQRDGLSNPENFNKHREAMQGFSVMVSTLAAAYKMTDDERFAAQALLHLKAWFVDTSTRMTPHLRFAQAIKGRVTGRGIGIIDTIHLIEITRAVEALSGSPSLKQSDAAAIRKWFSEYLLWLTTDQYGIDERETKNNHATWWVAQVAAFAHLVHDTSTLAFCRDRFRSVLLPNQMSSDGSFPGELRRTKPYNYSLFNLDGMAVICSILSRQGEDLWNYSLPDGRNMRKGMEFLYPYIVDKSKWPYPKDVMYFDEYPGPRPCLFLAGIALHESKYIAAWSKLDPDPANAEVQRGIPVRHPILWIQK